MPLIEDLSPLGIGLLCGGLCVSAIVLIFILPTLIDVLEIVFQIAEIALDLISGGPVAWCGCLALIAGCGICGGITVLLLNLLSTCGTDNAANICRLIP